MKAQNKTIKTCVRVFAILLAALFIILALPLHTLLAADAMYWEAKTAGSIPDVGERASVFIWVPGTIPYDPMDVSGLTFSATHADGSAWNGKTCSGQAGTAHRIWVRMHDDKDTFSAYCIQKEQVYPAGEYGDVLATIDNVIAGTASAQSMQNFLWEVIDWPAGSNYDAILWVLEHSYPAIPIETMMEDAGTSWNELYQDAYLGMESGRDEFEATFGSYEAGVELVCKGYVYNVVQTAIWYHEHAPYQYYDEAGNLFLLIGGEYYDPYQTGLTPVGEIEGAYLGDKMVNGPTALVKLYEYLCRDRDEYRNYRNYSYGTDISITAPDNMEPLRTEASAPMGMGDLYGPFALTTNMLSAGDVHMRLTGDDAPTVQMLSVTKDAGGAITASSVAGSVRMGEEFYIFVPGGAAHDFDCTLEASTANAVSMVGAGRGRVIQPVDATMKQNLQIVGMGGKTSTHEAMDSIVMPTFLSTTDAPVTGNITLRKTDLNGNPLAGAVLVVYNAAGAEVYRGTTAADGTVGFADVPAGSYYWVEEAAPAGYVLDQSRHNITVAEDGTVTGTLQMANTPATDEPVPGNVTLRKTDGAGSPLAGATLAIYTEEGAEYRRGTTDETGTVTFTDVPQGAYYWLETAAPAGYILDATRHEFSVDGNGAVTGTLQMQNTPTSVKVRKTDRGTGDALPGAQIGIYSAIGDEVGRYTTGEDGTFTVEALEPGDYYAQELAAPDGYMLNDELFAFAIAADGAATPEVVIPNDPEPRPSTVTIEKVDATSGDGLQGATISIYNAQTNELITSVTTNADGVATLASLATGAYYAQETTAPDGYVLNQQKYPFTVYGDGTETPPVSIPNSKTPNPTGTVRIYKSDAETGAAIAGASVEVYNSAGLAVYSGITGTDGYLPELTLGAGEYSFKELAAPNGYALNPNVFKFSVTADGVVTGTTSFTNEKAKYTVKKVDAANTGTPLSGATFTLYNASTNQALTSGTTDATGLITFSGLSQGKYYIKETKAPDGYVLANDIASFEVTGTWQNQSTPALIRNSKAVQTGVGSMLLPRLLLSIGGALCIAGGVFVYMRSRRTGRI